jgi:hypothetical protein
MITRTIELQTTKNSSCNTYQLVKNTAIIIAMASILSSPTKPKQPYLLEVPDDEFQRGRKRRRSSVNTPPVQIPSTGSTNLRGRGRRRSHSLSLTFSPSKSSPSKSLPADEKRKDSREQSPRGRKSPRRKYQKKNLMVPEVKRRRSQSPSRSRSGGDQNGTPKPRRRQRTRSRSRSHEVERGNAKGGRDYEVAVED